MTSTMSVTTTKIIIVMLCLVIVVTSTATHSMLTSAREDVTQLSSFVSGGTGSVSRHHRDVVHPNQWTVSFPTGKHRQRQQQQHQEEQQQSRRKRRTWSSTQQLQLYLSSSKSSQEGEEDPSSSSATSTSTRIAQNSPSEYSRQTRRLRIAATFCGAIATLSLAAKYDVVPMNGYTSMDMIYRDIGATSLTAVLAVFLVKAITWGYEEGYYSSNVGRKLNHTLAAPLFILFFPLFSSADGARFFAGLVTLSNVLRLYLAGKGLAEESSLASVVSRSGDKAEALGGPFIYVCLFQCFIWLFWRSSPVGVVGMSVMAAGDGMADLVGRRWGGNSQWQDVLRGNKNRDDDIDNDYKDKDSEQVLYGFGENKSVVGTTAFGMSAFLVTFALVQWLQFTGCMELPSYLGTVDIALRILLISFVTAIVELLPVGDDNYTVPLTAAAMTSLLLQ